MMIAIMRGSPCLTMRPLLYIRSIRYCLVNNTLLGKMSLSILHHFIFNTDRSRNQLLYYHSLYVTRIILLIINLDGGYDGTSK